jgi:hypothetical protein
MVRTRPERVRWVEEGYANDWAMKTHYKIYAIVGLFGVCAGAFCLRVAPRQTDVKASVDVAPPAALPSISFSKEVAATITKVELTQNEPHQAVALEREGTDWWVTSPVHVRASASKMTELLENLRNLRITEAVEPGADGLDAYQLADPEAFHVVASSGVARVSDLYFGRSDTFKRFARIGGHGGIFAVANSGPGGYLGFLYTRELRSWRETSILHFKESDAVEVDIVNKKGRLSFLRDGTSWSGTVTPRDRHGHLGQPKAAWPQFDPSRVHDFLRAFQSLSADDFGEESQRASSGVDHADETGGIVRIQLSGGASDRTIRVGRVSTNDGRWAIQASRWATLDGDPTVYVLAPWTAEWATADVSHFETSRPGEGVRLSSPRASGSAEQH